MQHATDPITPQLSISLFGGLRAEAAGRAAIELPRNHASALLAFFENALAAAAESVDAADRVRFLAHADSLYRGELLAGFYQDFFISEQTRIAQVYRGLLTELSRAYEELGELDRALEVARRAV